MEYISHTDYTNMLKNFRKSSAQQLNEAMSPSARRAFEKDLQSDPDYIELKKKAAIGTNMPDEVPNVAKRDHYVDDRFDDEFDDEEDFDYLEEKGLTPKQKKFAALAPPADKITYADKIVGAKKHIKKEGTEMDMSANNAKYPNSWQEGLNLPSPDMQATGPTIQTVEEDGHNAAYNFSGLSQTEREQLKEFIESVKTIKQEISKLLEKAKGGVKMEGGNTTDKVMKVGSDAQMGGTDAEVDIP